MGDRVILSGLWPKNQSVCVHLAARYGFDIATQRPIMSESCAEAIRSAGRRTLFLEEGEYAFERAPIVEEAQRRFQLAAGPLREHAVAYAGAARGERIANAVTRVISQNLAGAMLLLESIEKLGEHETVSAVVLNESEALFGKTVALWARSRKIPVFVLSHGAGVGEAYTVTRDFIADYLLFAGERGFEPYVDADFPAEQMFVGGNPAWDIVPQLLPRREEIRKKTQETLGLDPAMPTIVFATTWNARLTALQDSRIYTQTLRAFLLACRILRDSGLKFHALVKDRPPNAAFGKAETERLAQEVGLTDCYYAVGNMLETLMIADLFVGYDSSAFVEAMLLGVPSINIWAPSSFLIGPSFDRADNIPMVQQSSPGALAETMALILKDENVRAELVAAMAEKAKRYAYYVDGRAAERCAKAIVEHLS